MSKKYKWLIGLFAASLILNIFMIGMELGEGYKKKSYHLPPMAFHLKKLSRNLTKEERHKVRMMMREQRGTLSEAYRHLRETEKRINALIVAPEVDRAALKDALLEHGQGIQAMHAPIQDVLLEMVTSVDLETRKKLIADMFPPRKKEDGKPRGDEDHRERPHEDKEPHSDQ